MVKGKKKYSFEHITEEDSSELKLFELWTYTVQYYNILLIKVKILI